MNYYLTRMKPVIKLCAGVTLAVALLVAPEIIAESVSVDYEQQLEAQSESYETRLEVQEAEYVDTIIDLRQELRVTQFERDMAIDHIELVNAGY